ncbi:unnamed protein product [Debaryomyces tyrocola]|nr:unnamed protein product [Debaryomyces tyrocola]
MEVPLKANMSVDDISLDSRPVVTPERRARSSSPIKNRRSLPSNFFDMKLPSLPFASEEDIRSMTSGPNSSLSPKQLKLLSNSPAFSRLHVSTSPERSQYVIPIPFTLKLPPKLSSHNQNPPSSRSISPERSNVNERETSPTRSRSPNKLSRLVYNGNKYEKLESLSDSEDGEDERNHRLLMRRPAPPPVTTNKRKSKKQNTQAKQMSHDELSTIDETSNCANSRTPSDRSRKEGKSLPLPPSNEGINVEKGAPRSSHRASLSTPISVETPDKFTFRVPNTATPRDSYYRNLMIPNQNTFSIDHTPRMINSSVTRSSTEDNIRLLQSNAPTESNDTVLRIHKRSFSDESKVSSLSSFSSFGGILNTSPSPNLFINNQAGPQLLESKVDDQFRNIERSRTISNGSSTSCASEVSSNASWNSLQKSIDINDSNSLSESDVVQGKAMSPSGISTSYEDKTLGSENPDNNKHLQMTLGANEESICSDTDESEIADLYLNESEVSINDKTEVDVPICQKLTTYNESDNEGAGTRFNFPAGSRNITNSKELKQNITPGSSIRSSAYMAQYKSPNGQIEIPDLDDKSVTGKYSIPKSSCSFNGTTFNDINCENSDDSGIDSGDSSKLEPIGYPSKAARNVIKEQFKSMHGDDDSDTDIESAKYSNYSTTTPKSKSTPCLSCTERQLPLLPDKTDKTNSIKHPRPKSPVKHARHKSMFNIDFDATSVPKSAPQTLGLHKRSKSMDLNGMIPKSPSKSSNVNSETLPLKTKDTRKVATPEEMKILVTEPPKPIDYAVDFKEATSNDNFPVYPVASPNIKERYRGKEHSSRNHESIHNISKDLNGLNISQKDDNPSCTPYVTNQPQNYGFGLHPTPYNIPTSNLSNMTSSSSGSSYQSSRSTKNTNYTSMSDSDSVVIDLTKDKYDVCMIQRNSSTQSYRSVTERTKEGKEFEVVLVEDEDENNDEVDELASIYSKYRNNWIFRTGSTTSCTSNTSTASFESGVASESQLKLKPSVSLASRYKKIQSPRSIDRLSSQIQKQRFNEKQNLPLNASNVGYKSTRIQYPGVKENSNNIKPLTNELPKVQASYGKPEGIASSNLNSKYFDYTSDNYDFNSFMKQQVSPN